MTLAYMISTAQWDLTAAYTHLKAIRPKVKPKPNFLRQLIRFQAECNKNREREDADDAADADADATERERADDEKQDDDDEDDDLEAAHSKKMERPKKRKLGDDGHEPQKNPPRKRIKSATSGNAKKCDEDSVESGGRVFGMALPPHLVNQT